MVDYQEAARRLDTVERELDSVLNDFSEAEAAVAELSDAFEQLEANPHDDDALDELQSVARDHHPSYTSDEGVISRINSTIETFPGPAEDLKGTLETEALASSLKHAFGAFEDVASAFTYADSRRIQNRAEFVDELGDRIERAPDRLAEARNHLETAKGQFPDKRTSRQKIRDAQRERERREAQRMKEQLDDEDIDFTPDED